MATVSSAIWDTAGVTAFQALQAPFLITNYSLEGAVIDGDIGKSMIESADQQAGDVHVLAIHEGGLRKPFGARRRSSRSPTGRARRSAPRSRRCSPTA